MTHNNKSKAVKAKIIVVVFFITLSTIAQTQVKQGFEEKRILIAYFSYSGNTQTIANYIKDITGADIFEIKPTKAYPKELNILLDQVKEEARTHYQPALQTRVNHFEQYDIIILGTPIWWFTFAPPVSTFLTNYNFSGKTIVPFTTSEGSGLGIIESDIKRLCPNVVLQKGLSIKGSKVNVAKNDVNEWLKDLKIIK